MRIAVIRHPAPLIRPGICYGRLDVPVTPLAASQIDSLAADPQLRRATRVWTSPARRCRGFADAIAHALAVPLTIDPRLQELDFGAWEGQTWDVIARADLDRWAASPLTFAPPGGETGAQLVRRIRDFHSQCQRAAEDCVIVSHGGPLKVLLPLLLGLPVDLLANAPAIGSVRIVTCAVP